MTDLATLGGGYDYYSEASSINASGQVVGAFIAANGQSHIFITGPNGVGMTDLGAGRESSYINDAGEVVGVTETAADADIFITGPNGVGMTALNSLIDQPAWTHFGVGEPIGINNMGQIITIPEPESYALMLAGLALMGVMVRRKQRGRCGAE